MLSKTLRPATNTATDPTLSYVSEWFLALETLIRRSGGTAAQVRQLLKSRAAPGIVYAQAADGSWWSALGSRTGKFAPAPPDDGTRWYAPAALYWIRRGLLALRTGITAQEAARRNKDHFERQFVNALAAEPLAPHAFPTAFAEGRVDLNSARAIAATEWDSWRYGGYAVCLRSFTGTTCVQKEALGAFLRSQRQGEGDQASDDDVLDLVERLDLLLLPFAPFQRPTGTPGVAVDRVLAALLLGVAEPY